MNTLQINKIIKNIKCFVGTFPCDKIPILKKRPLCYIINTDPSSMPGEHWVGIYLKDGGRGEYFDSFGLEPLVDDVIKFLNVTCPEGFKHNTIALQSINEVTCGHYCIVFVILKSKGYKFSNILSAFSNYTNINDLLVKSLIKEWRRYVP